MLMDFMQISHCQDSNGGQCNSPTAPYISEDNGWSSARYDLMALVCELLYVDAQWKNVKKQR